MGGTLRTTRAKRRRARSEAHTEELTLEAQLAARHGRLTSPESAIGLQHSAGNAATAQLVQRERDLAVQRHAMAPQPVAEDEESTQRSIQRKAAAGSDAAVQRWVPWKQDRHPEQGQYNVRRGEALPSEKEMASATLKEKGRVTGQEVGDAARGKDIESAWEVLKDESLLEGMQRSLEEERAGKGRTGPTHGDYLELRLLAGEVLAAHADKPLVNIGMKLVAALKAEGRNPEAKIALWGFRIVPEIQRRSARKVIDSGELPPDAKYFDAGDGSTEGMVRKFLDKRKDVKLEQAYVPKEEIAPFAAALKSLPTVKFLLERPKDGGAKRTQDDKREWKDGGTLVDTVKFEDDAKRTPSFMRKKRINSRSFRQRLAAADAFIKNIVSPDFLARVPKPTVTLHTKPSPWFRASGSGGELDVAYNESKPVLAHEVGHAIETFLPMRYWHDMHLMLSARHEASGGGGARSGENALTKYTEGRHGGDYVTGKYTSTAYRSGMGEVVSMAFEFFMDPAKARKLIEGDPMHAALVLKAFNPAEYKGLDALRPFDKYLPHR